MADCWDDELLADSPTLLYLFRDSTGPLDADITDSSGNGNDGTWFKSTSLSFGASANSGQVATTTSTHNSTGWPTSNGSISTERMAFGATNDPFTIIAPTTGHLEWVAMAIPTDWSVTVPSGWSLAWSTSLSEAQYLLYSRMSDGSNSSWTTTRGAPGAEVDYPVFSGNATDYSSYTIYAETSDSAVPLDIPSHTTVANNASAQHIGFAGQATSVTLQGIFPGGPGYAGVASSSDSANGDVIIGGEFKSDYHLAGTWSDATWVFSGTPSSGDRVALTIVYEPDADITSTDLTMPSGTASYNDGATVFVGVSYARHAADSGGEEPDVTPPPLPNAVPAGLTQIATVTLFDTRWVYYRYTADGDDGGFPTNFDLTIGCLIRRARYSRQGYDLTGLPQFILGDFDLETDDGTVVGPALEAATCHHVQYFAHHAGTASGTWVDGSTTRYDWAETEAVTKSLTGAGRAAIWTTTVIDIRGDSPAFPDTPPAPICDPDCADVNAIMEYGFRSGGLGRQLRSPVFTSATDTWTIEAVVKGDLRIFDPTTLFDYTLVGSIANVLNPPRVDYGGSSSHLVANGQYFCWRHIVIVHDFNEASSERYQLYVDGVKVDTDSSTINETITQLHIADDVYAENSRLATLAFYPTALSAARVAAHAAHLCGLCPQGGWHVGYIGF